MNKPKSQRITDAVEIIRRRFIDGRPDMEALVEREWVNAEVAQAIYDMRTQARLTQRQLAERIGTTASVISRLEDADYQGHSLTMLQRIAAALHCRLQVRIVPREPAKAHRSPKKRKLA